MKEEVHKQLDDDSIVLAQEINKLMRAHFEKYPFLREPRIDVNWAEDHLGQQIPYSVTIRFESDIKEYRG